MTMPKIIYQDKNILIINKPSGLVVNRAESVKGKTLQDWVEENFEIHPAPEAKEVIAPGAYTQDKLQEEVFRKRSGIVHRLDKDTSGVLIVSKTPKAFKQLQKQFKERKVKKEYLALVHNRVEPKKGNIKIPIGRNPSNRRKFTIRLHGKKSTTHFSVKKYYPKFTYLKIQPKTGRTHQIRVHLKHIGHPIVSDPIYLGEKRFKKDIHWCPRLFLHAKKINFVHPQKNNRVEYCAQLPKDLEKVLEKLKNEKNI